MPILPPQPDIYPSDLLDQVGLADDCTPCWWALYTMPRREKDLMRRLRAMDIAYYGPLVKRRRRSPAGRVRTSQVPLFAGYVFLHGDEHHRQQALTTNCISRCLRIPSKEELVRDLRQIKRMIDSEAPLTPESRIESGMRVRIRGGSLAGLEGTVVSRRGGDRLLVVVKFLQQGASVQLDDFQVERLDG